MFRDQRAKDEMTSKSDCRKNYCQQNDCRQNDWRLNNFKQNDRRKCEYNVWYFQHISGHRNIQHNDIQYAGLFCDTEHNDSRYQHLVLLCLQHLFKCYAECCYAEHCKAECCYTECRYTECHYGECCVAYSCRNSSSIKICLVPFKVCCLFKTRLTHFCKLYFSLII